MSAEEDEGQEKSHEPSERRLERAREQGDLPQSQDAQAAIAYIGFAAALFLMGADGATDLGEALRPFLAMPDRLALAGAADHGGELFMELFTQVFLAAAPLLLLPGLLVIALLTAQRGVVLAPSKIVPKLSRISPVENAKNRYGPRGLFEFAKSTAKLCLLLAVLGVVLRSEVDRIPAYARFEARLSGMVLDIQLWSILAGVLVVAPAVGLADFLWQRHEYRNRNRMSYEDMKKERKESEGDPHVQSARRERARAIAQNRMLEEVPRADVVITNPEHFAVALVWDRTAGVAPVCIAKGVDEVAARIRERAEEAGVPLHPDPPTARALYAVTGIGEEIRPEHYRAVAAAILFADAMRKKRQGDAGPEIRIGR